jgi:anti-sigma-K factor RskA
MTPAERDTLAAEIALGLLSEEKTNQVLRVDPALALDVARWQEALAVLAAGVSPVPPSAGVIARIKAQVPAQHGVAAEVASVGWLQALWQSMAFWRGLAMTGAVAASVAIGVLVFSAPTLRAPDNSIVAKAEVQLVLTSALVPGDGPAYFVVTYDGPRGQLIAYPTARIFERGGVPYLWLVPGEDKEPIGIGPLNEDKPTALKLASLANLTVKERTGLVVTMEPSATIVGAARGRVIAHGKLAVY